MTIGKRKKRDQMALSTKREIEFLEGLGTWSEGRQFSRSYLLSRYKETFHLRDVWGELDRDRVWCELERMIKEESGVLMMLMAEQGEGEVSAK